MKPIGPAPVISTSSPSRSNDSAVWTALPNGSKIDCTSREMACLAAGGSMAGSWTQTFVIGSARILGERAGPIDADALGVLAQMPPAGEAVAAAAADDVALAADDVAGVKVVDVRADLDDLADELVADDHRHGDRLLAQASQL